jgi:sialic acid synthase SpsE
MKNTYIIAEMAWGYTGSFEKAVKMLEGTKGAGADAIGIHLTDMAAYMTKDYKCIAGQTLSDSADNTESIYNYLDQINLKNDQWIEFNKKAKELDMGIVAMCNDESSYEFSLQMDVTYYVISAASFTEFGLVRRMSKDNSKLLLRIGGATLFEIHSVLNVIKEANKDCEVGMLCGIQLYPTSIDQLHFASIPTLQEEFSKYSNVSFGIADHIDGDDVMAGILPILALPYSIDYIEKHVTIDRKDKLEDYEAALGIEQFENFVKTVRAAEIALGDGNLDYLRNDNYKKYREVVRKKIVAKHDLEKGELLTEDNLNYKRTDYGLPIEEINNVVGKVASKDIYFDEGITSESIS